jgi:hypothetical protein
MRYLLMIYTDETADQNVSEAQQAAVMEEYNKFTSDITSSGVYLAGEALQPTTTATTVRVRDGKTSTTDGPFAETKEQIGGYYLVNAKDLNEAISWAAKIPGAKWGSIEVRPIWEFPAQ